MMLNTVEKSIPFQEPKYNVIVTSPSSVNSAPLLPIGISQPSAQQEQVCIVITDPNQQKQLANPLLSNVISYSNAIPQKLYYLGQDLQTIIPASPPAPESNISADTPTRPELSNIHNVSFFPKLPSQPLIAKTIPILKPGMENLPSSTSSSEAISEKIPEYSGNDASLKSLDRRLKQIEGLMKQSIRLQKKHARHQERMEKIFYQCMKEKFEEHTISPASNRSVHFQRYLNDAQPQHLFRLSSQSENILVPVMDSSSPSDSPPLYYEAQKDETHSPNLTIDVSLMDSVGTGHNRSPHHKYHSHSCSMYNKSIRDFSDAETIQWLDRILPILGNSVTVQRIQEVLSQTNTITHFTAEFQKVVFTNNERKTLTTSGKFRKRKLERIVLGPLDVAKLQGIIQLSLYLFGVTEKDEERVKYQLKQAIDEKNRREFYREDRGTKRVHLS